MARDQADYLYNSGQNDASRQNNLAIATIQGEATARGKSEGGGSIAGIAGSVLGDIFSSFAGSSNGSSLISTGIKKLPSFLGFS